MCWVWGQEGPNWGLRVDFGPQKLKIAVFVMDFGSKKFKLGLRD